MSCDDSRDAELIDRRDGDKLIAPRLVTRQASARRIHASDGGIGIDGVAGVEKARRSGPVGSSGSQPIEGSPGSRPAAARFCCHLFGMALSVQAIVQAKAVSVT